MVTRKKTAFKGSPIKSDELETASKDQKCFSMQVRHPLRTLVSGCWSLLVKSDSLLLKPDHLKKLKLLLWRQMVSVCCLHHTIHSFTTTSSCWMLTDNWDVLYQLLLQHHMPLLYSSYIYCFHILKVCKSPAPCIPQLVANQLKNTNFSIAGYCWGYWFVFIHAWFLHSSYLQLLRKYIFPPSNQWLPGSHQSVTRSVWLGSWQDYSFSNSPIRHRDMISISADSITAFNKCCANSCVWIQ